MRVQSAVNLLKLRDAQLALLRLEAPVRNLAEVELLTDLLCDALRFRCARAGEVHLSGVSCSDPGNLAKWAS